MPAFEAPTAAEVPPAEVFFAQLWPAMSRSVGRHLGRVGVPVQDRDDVLQETALRLYRTWSTLEPGRPVEPFARTVAVNVWRDRWRHSRDREVLSEQLPEPRAARDDVEDTVVARLELHRVARALRQLRPGQQETVLRAMEHELAPDSAAPVPAVMRMARMRARRSLVACLQTASAMVAGLVVWARRLSAQSPVAAPMALAGMVLLTGLAVLGGGGHMPAVPGSTQLSLPAAAAGHQPAASLTTSATRVPGAHLRKPAARSRAAAAGAPPFVVDTPVGQAGAAFEIQVGGSGARVSGDGTYPVCVFGVDPAGKAGLACRAEKS